jgi:hypothetical protein
MLPREVRDGGWAKKCPKVEVDRLPSADIPPVVNSGGHEDMLKAIFKNDLFPAMSISRQQNIKSLRVCICIWIELDIYIALLLALTTEEEFTNLGVIGITFGTGS